MGSELPDGSVLVTWSDRGCFCKAPHHGGHKQWHGEKPLDFLRPNTGAAPGRTSSAQEWGEGNRQNCESPKTLNTVFFLYSHLSLPTRNQCWTPDKASCTGEFARKTGVLHLRSPAAPQPCSGASGLSVKKASSYLQWINVSIRKSLDASPQRLSFQEKISRSFSPLGPQRDHSVFSWNLSLALSLVTGQCDWLPSRICLGTEGRWFGNC